MKTLNHRHKSISKEERKMFNKVRKFSHTSLDRMLYLIRNISKNICHFIASVSLVLFSTTLIIVVLYFVLKTECKIPFECKISILDFVVLVAGISISFYTLRRSSKIGVKMYGYILEYDTPNGQPFTERAFCLNITNTSSEPIAISSIYKKDKGKRICLDHCLLTTKNVVSSSCNLTLFDLKQNGKSENVLRMSLKPGDHIDIIFNENIDNEIFKYIYDTDKSHLTRDSRIIFYGDRRNYSLNILKKYEELIDSLELEIYDTKITNINCERHPSYRKMPKLLFV